MVMLKSCEIQNLKAEGGSLDTLFKMCFRSTASIPSSVPSRPRVPPTFFSDLAFSFSFSAFFGGGGLFYLSLLTLIGKGTENRVFSFL